MSSSVGRLSASLQFGALPTCATVTAWPSNGIVPKEPRHLAEGGSETLKLAKWEDCFWKKKQVGTHYYKRNVWLPVK